MEGPRTSTREKKLQEEEEKEAEQEEEEEDEEEGDQEEEDGGRAREQNAREPKIAQLAGAAHGAGAGGDLVHRVS